MLGPVCGNYVDRRLVPPVAAANQPEQPALSRTVHRNHGHGFGCLVRRVRMADAGIGILVGAGEEGHDVQ